MAGKYRQLKAQIAKLEEEAAAARKVEAPEAVATIKALMAEFGLTAEDLGFKSAGKAAKAKGPGAPKYRDPQTGKTWTGRGKPPAWMAVALKAGTSDAFLIQAETAPVHAVAQKPSRPRKTATTSAAAAPTAAKKRSARPAAKGAAAKGASKPAKRPRKKAEAAPTSSPSDTPVLESPAQPAMPPADEIAA